jgi:hypothetical protein
MSLASPRFFSQGPAPSSPTHRDLLRPGDVHQQCIRLEPHHRGQGQGGAQGHDRADQRPGHGRGPGDHQRQAAGPPGTGLARPGERAPRCQSGTRPAPGPRGKIALRISPDRHAAGLVQQVGPITSTSANRTGEPPARTAEEVERLGLDIDAVLDGGRTPGGKPSTLIDLTAWPPACLREGAVPFADILALIP